ncbi:hypothetical protein [Novosphingobium sp. Chol11]|uniref:hypothetical protein n=1 Tax=Novosphingobium sp. Chol11 TaxID=1385763 RepID=UPI0025E43C7F|nr:hypothetical protein [Novosphingobium sp. Chol11]
MSNTKTANAIIAEMREFAGFSACEQRYIRRSLDIGLARHNALERWSRGRQDAATIRTQYVVYQDLKLLRGKLPADVAAHLIGVESLDDFMGPLLRVTTFDLAQASLASFSAYRFLYERLLGAEARPWLPSAFCGAAALPQIRPENRKGLLQSISEAAATAPGWSMNEPVFFPEFVELDNAA